MCLKKINVRDKLNIFFLTDVYGIQKKHIRNTETAHQILQRSESWLLRNQPKCTKIWCFWPNRKFWYVLVNFSVTITRIFARFGTLFLYFKSALPTRTELGNTPGTRVGPGSVTEHCRKKQGKKPENLNYQKKDLFFIYSF